MLKTRFQKLVAKQLARPTGWFGRLLIARWLEKGNIGMNELTLKRLGLQTGDRLLEVGFGSGYLLDRMLQEDVCELVAGVDTSEDMVNLVGKRLRDSVKSGQLILKSGTIEALPFEDQSFSKLCTVNTLYFWHNPDLALSECKRVVINGGLIAICFDAKESLEKWPGHIYGFTLYDLQNVIDMLARSGFVCIQSTEGFDADNGAYYCVTAVA